MNKDEVIKCKDCRYFFHSAVTPMIDVDYYMPSICLLFSTIHKYHEVSKDDFCSKAERIYD